jgi:hypothetical protein
MRREERQAYGLNGVGLGATVVALCVPQLWPHGPWYLWQGILWVGIVLIALGIVILLCIHLSLKKWVYGLFDVLFLSIGSGAWYYKNLSDHTPLSLLEVYITGKFPGTAPVRSDALFDNKDLSLHVRGVMTKYYEFNANAYYFSVYIPRSQYTYLLCSDLAINFRNRFSELFSWVRTASRIPGDSSMMDESEMIFTGRVYLYSQKELSPLSPDQIGELFKLYKQNNLFMQYRGSEYLSHHWQEYERRNDPELKQFKEQPDHDKM